MPDFKKPLGGSSGDRQHLKFNREVLPEFKRRRDDSQTPTDLAPAKRLAGRETDSILKWVGLLIVILGLAAAVGLFLKKGSGRAKEASLASVAGDEREKERALVIAAVTKYLASATLNERLELVRRRDAVGPRMARFYEEHGLFPTKVWNFSSVEPRSIDGVPFWYAVVETPDGRESLQLESRGGDYLVDWESHVGFNGISLEECLAERPADEIKFRVLASPDNYYNPPFGDSEEYQCVKLEFAGDSRVVFGYIRRESPDFATLFNLIEGRKQIPLQLALQWREGDPSRLPQVAITGLEAGHWIEFDR